MLIKCAECGKEVSLKATTCPNCGNTVNSTCNSCEYFRDSGFDDGIPYCTKNHVDTKARDRACLAFEEKKPLWWYD